MTIKDLRKHLETTRQSPEQLAQKVNVSNMTIRRLLKRPDDEKIPAKYIANFSRMMSPNNSLAEIEQFQNVNESEMSFEDVIEDLKQTGEKVKDPVDVEVQLNEKLTDPRIKGDFLSRVKYLKDVAFDKHATRLAKAVAFGALLYLINPMDLIPDNLVPFGYVDDLAILSIAIGYLMRKGLSPSHSASVKTAK
jgi:uncharacterized membrane protein YkvA (DUF1232 family)